MRIEALNPNAADALRVAATVVWEDCDRPSREIYFETDQAFGAIWPASNAFLLGSYQPAMRHGERRIRVEGRFARSSTKGCGRPWPGTAFGITARTPAAGDRGENGRSRAGGAATDRRFPLPAASTALDARRNQLRCPASIRLASATAC